MDTTAAAVVLMLSALTVLLTGVESQQRTCYFGPPPEPDPDHPGDWMKQVMQKVRERCPGRRQHASAGHATTGDETTPASHTTVGEETTLTECTQHLGMEDLTIVDQQITASSVDDSHDSSQPRLNYNGDWRANNGDENPWIEVDLLQSTVVSGVITQGGAGSYVMTYAVAYQRQYSSEREHVTDNDGNPKVFIGNVDEDTPVTNLFDTSVRATVVRIEPLTYDEEVRLRFELLGCRLH